MYCVSLTSRVAYLLFKTSPSYLFILLFCVRFCYYILLYVGRRLRLHAVAQDMGCFPLQEIESPNQTGCSRKGKLLASVAEKSKGQMAFRLGLIQPFHSVTTNLVSLLLLALPLQWLALNQEWTSSWSQDGWKQQLGSRS